MPVNKLFTANHHIQPAVLRKNVLHTEHNIMRMKLSFFSSSAAVATVVQFIIYLLKRNYSIGCVHFAFMLLYNSQF